MLHTLDISRDPLTIFTQSFTVISLLITNPMQFAHGAIQALDGDSGGTGFLFFYGWIVEFKPPATAVPLASTTVRDKICSLFGAIVVKAKEG